MEPRSFTELIGDPACHFAPRTERLELELVVFFVGADPKPVVMTVSFAS